MAYRDRDLLVQTAAIYGMFEFNAGDGTNTIGTLSAMGTPGSRLVFPTAGGVDDSRYVDGPDASAGNYRYPFGDPNEFFTENYHTIGSVTCWVKRPAFDVFADWLFIGNAGGDGISLSFNPSQSAIRAQWAGTAARTIDSADLSGRVDEWIFVAITWSSGDGHRLYIDGVEVGNATWYGGFSTLSIDDATLIARSSFANTPKVGVDQLTFRNQVLTADEVLFLYQGEPAGPPVGVSNIPYEFYLDVYNRDGTRKLAAVTPLELRYTDHINEPYDIVWTLDSEHQAAGELAEYDIVVVYMRNLELGISDAAGGFVVAVVGILRDWDVSTNPQGLTYIEYIAHSDKSILSWRHILFKAGLANRSTWAAVAAEKIMKEIVEFNLTSTASVANGREREGDLAPGMLVNLTIASDAGQGSVLSRSFAWANVLEALNDISLAAGGDWGLLWQGGNNWIFEFFVGQLGEDKTTGPNLVLFSLSNNTLAEPLLERRGARGTVALVAGQGDAAARATAVVTGPSYAADNDIEHFVDARDEDVAANLTDRGKSENETTKERRDFSFTVLQTSDTFYSPVNVPGRKVYRTGDIVVVDYGGELVNRKVQGIAVLWAPLAAQSPTQIEVIVNDSN